MTLVETFNEIYQVEELGVGISKISQWLTAKDVEDYLRLKRENFKTYNEWIDFINRRIIITKIKRFIVK